MYSRISDDEAGALLGEFWSKAQELSGPVSLQRHMYSTLIFQLIEGLHSHYGGIANALRSKDSCFIRQRAERRIAEENERRAFKTGSSSVATAHNAFAASTGDISSSLVDFFITICLVLLSIFSPLCSSLRCCFPQLRLSSCPIAPHLHQNVLSNAVDENGPDNDDTRVKMTWVVISN